MVEPAAPSKESKSLRRKLMWNFLLACPLTAALFWAPMVLPTHVDSARDLLEEFGLFVAYVVFSLPALEILCAVHLGLVSLGLANRWTGELGYRVLSLFVAACLSLLIAGAARLPLFVGMWMLVAFCVYGAFSKPVMRRRVPVV